MGCGLSKLTRARDVRHSHPCRINFHWSVGQLNTPTRHTRKWNVGRPASPLAGTNPKAEKRRQSEVIASILTRPRQGACPGFPTSSIRLNSPSPPSLDTSFCVSFGRTKPTFVTLSGWIEVGQLGESWDTGEEHVHLLELACAPVMTPSLLYPDYHRLRMVGGRDGQFVQLLLCSTATNSEGVFRVHWRYASC